MSRYIDTDDVANAIYHHFPSIRTMADARGIIEEAPSIDIVRCKECRHWEMRISPRGWCVVHQGYVSPQYFCADGEREGER